MEVNASLTAFAPTVALANSKSSIAVFNEESVSSFPFGCFDKLASIEARGDFKKACVTTVVKDLIVNATEWASINRSSSYLSFNSTTHALMRGSRAGSIIN